MVRATAWISSTMHHSRAGEHLPRPRGEHQVERLRRGDEHVGRVAQHRCALLLRRVAGADGRRRCRRRSPSAARAGSSRRRRRGPSAARRRRAGSSSPPSGSATRRSRPQRNAASVLPEPVGAETITCSPPAIAGQAWCCASVGSSNERVNQSRTCGVKPARGSERIDPSMYSSAGSGSAAALKRSVDFARASCPATPRRGARGTRPRRSFGSRTR